VAILRREWKLTDTANPTRGAEHCRHLQRTPQRGRLMPHPERASECCWAATTEMDF